MFPVFSYGDQSKIQAEAQKFEHMASGDASANEWGNQFSPIATMAVFGAISKWVVPPEMPRLTSLETPTTTVSGEVSAGTSELPTAKTSTPVGPTSHEPTAQISPVETAQTSTSSGTAAVSGAPQTAHVAGAPELGPARGTGQTFEILDGVRRAKAAAELGHVTIEAQVQVGGRTVQIGSVPIEALRSPFKNAIDVSNATMMQRWLRVLRGTQAGDPLPPIIVQPGANGATIPQIQFIF